MVRLSLLTALIISILLSPSQPLQAQSELILGTASIADSSISLSINSMVDLQAIHIACEFDDSLIEVIEYLPTSALDNAVVLKNYFAGGFTLQMIPSFSFAGEVILPANGNVLLGQIFFEANEVAIDQEIIVPIEFASTPLGNPEISNELIDSNGRVIDATNGLQFISGSGIIPVAAISFELGHASGPLQTASNIFIDSNTPLSGFVIALSIGQGLNLSQVHYTDIPGTYPELITINNQGDKLTVILMMDESPPFTHGKIPVGRHSVLHLQYDCNISPGGAAYVPVTLGPVLGMSNVATSFGVDLTPSLLSGYRLCGTPRFWLGDPDSPAGEIWPARGTPGGLSTIGAFLSNPEGNIQGVQLAIEFDPNLKFISAELTPEVADLVEFFNFTFENNLLDGDGHEFVCGALLDALPPFDGQTFPPTGTSKLHWLTLEVEVDAAATPGALYPVLLLDNINGNGDVMIENQVTQNFQAGFPILEHGAVKMSHAFTRGDSNRDTQLTVSDAIELLAILFASRPAPDCLGACDVNNDTRIDLGDAITLYSYLFYSGSAPASPYPDCATINTGLQCYDGLSCP